MRPTPVTSSYARTDRGSFVVAKIVHIIERHASAQGTAYMGFKRALP